MKIFLGELLKRDFVRYATLDVVYLDTRGKRRRIHLRHIFTYLSLVFNNKSYQNVKRKTRSTYTQVNDRRMLQDCRKVDTSNQ